MTQTEEWYKITRTIEEIRYKKIEGLCTKEKIGQLEIQMKRYCEKYATSFNPLHPPSKLEKKTDE